MISNFLCVLFCLLYTISSSFIIAQDAFGVSLLTPQKQRNVNVV